MFNALVRIARSFARGVAKLAGLALSALAKLHQAHRERMQYDAGYVTALFAIVINLAYLVFAERRVRAHLEHLARGLVSGSPGRSLDIAY
jgi:hypothetical protein